MARIHEPLTIEAQMDDAFYVEESLGEDDTVQVWSQAKGDWVDCTINGEHDVRLPDDWQPHPDAEETATLPHRVVDRDRNYEPETTPGEQVDLEAEYVEVERRVAAAEAEGEEPEKFLKVRRKCIRDKLIDEGQDVPEMGEMFEDDGHRWLDVAVERTRQAQKLREAYNDAKAEVRELRQELSEKAAE